MMPVCRTEFVYPPIPSRSHDWVALIDGNEEDGNYGYGKTEIDAIVDLTYYIEDTSEMLAVFKKLILTIQSQIPDEPPQAEKGGDRDQCLIDIGEWKGRMAMLHQIKKLLREMGA